MKDPFLKIFLPEMVILLFKQIVNRPKTVTVTFKTKLKCRFLLEKFPYIYIYIAIIN